MAILEEVNQAFEERGQVVRENYLAALRERKPAAEIVKLAEAARITPEQVRRDVEVLDRAADLARRVVDYDKLRKAAASTEEKAAAAVEKMKAATAAIEAEADAVCDVARAAAADLGVAKRAAHDLAALYRARPDVLDAIEAPAAVAELLSKP